MSICITSYNRPNELKRCLESIDCVKYVDDIEIIVSEDRSPHRDQIEKIVLDYKQKYKCDLIFNSNISNLGYDMNLGKLISLSNAKYILFISDDDCFIENSLDKTIETVMKNNYSLAFSPFYLNSISEYRRVYKNVEIIKATEVNAKRYLYCSILFSGLIFERNYIVQYDSLKFFNVNYFQVYLFLNVIYKHGAGYIDVPLINCIGDGVNGFGLSESSEKNEHLADRKSLYSKLEFHKGLIKTIVMFDNENGTNLKHAFSKMYSYKTYTDLSYAKSFGFKIFKTYWGKLVGLDLELTLVVYVYVLILLLFGSKVSNIIMFVPKRVFMKIKQYV